ncbi:hypothetical protein RKE29_09420 [Streptomyces sp. B1866]|uniref:hypothetical protein n=1 Tax=Streptomyces sp. B1866 TaxID=3075431 RepID=UPI0028919653|nr:hypothetical protein [Streptomyces sp. B1866]MDT3396860.1 hypothetical protein [Streptomyces sp. B1866]
MRFGYVLIRVALAALVGLGLVAALQAPVQADGPHPRSTGRVGTAVAAESWDEQMHTDDSDPGGRVRFRADGDVAEVCDVEADGWAVDFQVFFDAPMQDFVIYEYQIGGSGRCQVLRASLGSPYDLAENQIYGFRICLTRSGGELRYCDYAYWRA